MRDIRRVVICCFVLACALMIMVRCTSKSVPVKDTVNQRMQWWREARFGLFIHWGLYAIPAGEWDGNTRHGEWIMHSAKIPVSQYEKFRNRFNPVKFNADEWVRIAKEAGMKYIVITSKHHDGFCLFDSEHTDYDIMSTPFKRDIMRELADACTRNDLRICWYHSIMDWHHPDYLPRRDWEMRSTEGADLNRYIFHLKNQVRELLTNYGPIGVMWFDGEWEGTWKHEFGLDLYNFCLELQPDVIVNNRVDKGRSGMAGMTVDETYAGDFGTPEQEIPSTGLLGVDWETCMTMNQHWGYNKYDKEYKSTEDLIRKLADIASKGGNFLLNVGPTDLGEFPPESIDRLQAIGRWMNVNSEAIYSTSASPFKRLSWGRCTQKSVKGGLTRLYLHVFEWPHDGKLIVPGIYNRAAHASLLSDPERGALAVSRKEDALVIQVPVEPPDPINSVVLLDIHGKPDISEPPEIAARMKIFVDTLDVIVTSERENIEIRYTTDGIEPTLKAALIEGPVRLTRTATVSARSFRDGKPVSRTGRATFTMVLPRPSVQITGLNNGLQCEYYEGNWDSLPDFNTMTPSKTETVEEIDFSIREREEHFGFQYSGYILVP